jgi:hypothetical protein
MSENVSISRINHLLNEFLIIREKNIKDLERVVKSFAAGPNLYVYIRYDGKNYVVQAFDNEWDMFLTRKDNTFNVTVNTSDNLLFRDIGLFTAMYYMDHYLENSEYVIRTLLLAWTGSNERVSEIMEYCMSSTGCLIRMHSNNIADVSAEQALAYYNGVKSSFWSQSI